MTQSSEDPALPTLFTHSLRKEWGVGVLAGENQGNRRYLFDNGEERTVAGAFQNLMRQVERPTPDQQVIYARLRAKLAAREGAKDGRTGGEAFLAQLARLHQSYPAGVGDPQWVADMRGDSADKGKRPRRNKAIEKAQELLAEKAIDALLGAQKFGDVCERIRTVLELTDLVPAAKTRKSPGPDQFRAIALTARELLYGTGPYEQRFDRHVTALTEAYGAPARWEEATALPALVYPAKQVCVEPRAFRAELKVLGLRGSTAAQPNGATYMRFLAVAHQIANKLGDRGQIPRDLLDVHDFIRFTLRPASKAKVATVRAAKKRAAESESAESDGADLD